MVLETDEVKSLGMKFYLC